MPLHGNLLTIGSASHSLFGISSRRRSDDRKPGPLCARLHTRLSMFQNDWIDNVTAHDAVHSRKPLSLRFQQMIVDLGIHRTVTSQAIHNFSMMYLAGAVLHCLNFWRKTVQTSVHNRGRCTPYSCAL